MKKRMLSTLVAFVLAIGLLPATAAAANATSVEVGGMEVTDATYWKWDGSSLTSNDCDDSNYYVMYEPTTATLTLRDFSWSGNGDGIYANGDLNIVLKGENSITSLNAYGIHGTGDLNISGAGELDESLTITSHENGIFAFEPYQLYQEDIVIEDTKITVTSSGDVGIVGSHSLTIRNSMIDSTGTYQGLQGGKFTDSEPAIISITNSTITAKATDSEGTAFKSAPTVTGAHQWRDSDSGEWTAYDSEDDDFASAEYVEMKPGTPAPAIVNPHPVSSVTIAGQTLNSSKPYYHNGTASNRAGVADNVPNGASAHFADGVLTLNGLNVSDGSISWSYDISGNGNDDLIIVLESGSVNTVTSTAGSAIKGESGNADGPSLTITTSGDEEATLYAVGANCGLWIWENTTIEGYAKVIAQGGSGIGIAANAWDNSGVITIKDNADVKAVGGTYGIAADHYNLSAISVEGGQLLAQGGTKAMQKAPSLAGTMVSSGAWDDTTYWAGTTGAARAAKPATVFAATDATSGVLSGVTDNMQYKLGHSDWVDITDGMITNGKLTLSDLPNNVATSPKLTISVQDTNGTDNTDDDSDVQVFVPDMTISEIYSIDLDIADVYTFETVAEKTVTVLNNGTAATGELTVALSGADADSFEVDPATISSIGVDGTATFTVAPKADLDVSTYTATVTVSGGNGISESFVVNFEVSAPGTVSLANHGYPYGRAMDASSGELFMELATSTGTPTYQWQEADTKDGNYSDMSGKTAATLPLSDTAHGKWYRCVVNGTLTSEAVQVVKPQNDTRTWTGYSGYYYISNGIVAYRVDLANKEFDVTGAYSKTESGTTTNYMLRTSYSDEWKMYSTTETAPNPIRYYNAAAAKLDALRVYFDSSDDEAVFFEADLQGTEKSFSFGCDTMIGNYTSNSYSDTALLAAVVKNDKLEKVAMIGAKNLTEKLDTDPAFTIAPEAETPATNFWVGYFSGRDAYGYNTDNLSSGIITQNVAGQQVAVRVENTDSGMTMSWLNLQSDKVGFEFKVGAAIDVVADIYEVTFNANGHGTTTTATVTSGEQVVEPAEPTADGYTFGGWYTDSTCTTAYDFTTPVTGNITLYAKWTEDDTPSAPSTPPTSGSDDYYEPSYPVKVVTDEGTNVKVVSDHRSAEAGETVTIEVSPKPYYQVEDVVVKDQNGKIIEVKENKDGTFSFKMPASKVTVEAVYSWDNPFVDVNEDAYYAPAVEWALNEEITGGTTATTFAPNAACTRAQMVTFLWRAAGCPEPEGDGAAFVDVSADAYFAEAVQWAVEQGITNGTTATTFSPYATCTRAHMAAFLFRMEDGEASGTVNPFTDVPTGAYYADPVQWAVENGITNGTGDGTTYSPNAICTRGQMVTFLWRCLG